MRELLQAGRNLRRHRRASLAIVMTLALPLSASIAVLSLARGYFFAPEHIDRPRDVQLLRLRLTKSDGEVREQDSWSYPLFTAAREAGEPELSLAAYTAHPRWVQLSADGRARRSAVEFVSATYFPLLGVEAARGRVFLPEEDETPGSHPVVLLGDEVWRSAFGADPSVVGSTLRLDGFAFTVVGVLPAGFRGLSERAQLWVPMNSAPILTFSRRLTGQLSFWHSVIARFPESRTPEGALTRAAQAGAAAVALPEAFGPVRLEVAPVPFLQARRSPTVARLLALLAAAAGVLLLVGMANAANLVVGRLAARGPELAVRQALGADGRSLAWLLGGEAVALALVAGMVSAVVAPIAVRGLVILNPAALDAMGVAAMPSGGLRPADLASSLALAVLVGLSLGAVSHGIARRRGPGGDAIRQASRVVAADGRVRRTLIVTQLALAVVLASSAGLLLESLGKALARPLGFDPRRVLTFQVELPKGTHSEEQIWPFLSALTRRLQALPGVETAAVAQCLPLTGDCDRVQIVEQGRPAGDEAPGLPARLVPVDAGLVAALDIPLLDGRGLEARDDGDAPPVVLLGASAAKALWPAGSAVGRRLRVSVGWPETEWAEVVGVVGDTADASPLEPGSPAVYLPIAQFAYRSNYMVVETSGAPEALQGQAIQALRDMDPNLAAWDPASMEERVGRAVGAVRFAAWLVTVVAGAALVLAALGTYAVLAAAVRSRRRELAVRAACGARSDQLLRQVLGQGLRLGVGGALLGLVGAVAAGRLLTGLLVGVEPADPATLLSAAVLLVAAAVLASALPAREAARVDPARALRED